MTTIKPTLWRRQSVIAAVAVAAFCLIPAAIPPYDLASLLGPAALVGLALMVWLFTRPMRLEITETQVRAFHGVGTAPRGRKEAFRSDIRSIHLVPSGYSFRAADGQTLMVCSVSWTLPDMTRAAEVLRVPLYDDRVGQLKVRERNGAKLVYDPRSGLGASK